MILNITSPQYFETTVAPVLSRFGVRYSLMLGILRQVAHVPDRYPDGAFTASVFEGDDLLLAALRTPPYKLLLYTNGPQTVAMRMLAQYLDDAGEALPGVLAEDAVADDFAEVWREFTGATAEVGQFIRLHELTEVQPVAAPSGHASWMAVEDAPVLSEWILDFHREATPYAPAADPAKLLARNMGRDTLLVWRDPEPVAMAMLSRPTGDCAGVGLVYTPEDCRRRGYATALVAELSRLGLERGYKRCTLYTDLANPISNSIYAKIGYKPVSDWKDYIFTYDNKESSC